MQRYRVAHVRQQGVDLVIIPLESSFRLETLEQKNAVRDTLQVCASAAGLAGTVVPVWDDGGRMGFLAPRSFRPFFASLNLRQVFGNVNRELTCSC